MRLASRIAWRSSASRPARTLTSILGIAVGIATVLSVLVVDHNTILTERLLRPSYSGKPDVTLRPVDAGAPSGGPASVPEALLRDPDLEQVVAHFQSRIRVLLPGGGGRDARDLELVAVEPEAGARFAAWRVVDGAAFSATDASEVLVASALAAELGIAPGDTVHLQRALPSVRQCREGAMVQVRDEKIESEPEPFRVAGLIEDDHLGRRRAVLVPYARAAVLYEGAHVQPVYWAKLVPGAIHQDVAERLKATFVVEKPKDALVGERVDQLAFRKSIRITASLALLLGLFVIYNAFSLSLVERVREIGLLRALGLTHREIALSVVLEGLVLAALGALAGIALTAGVVKGMQALRITTLGFAKPLQIHDVPWDVVAVIVGAGMAAALLGVVTPLLRVRRLSVIDALRAGQIAYRPDPTRLLRALLLSLLPAALLLVYVQATPPLGERQDEVFHLVARVALWLSLCFGVVLLAPQIVQWSVLLLVRLLLIFRPNERPIAAASTRGSHHRVFGSAMGIALVLAAVLAIHGITGSLKDEGARFAERTLAGRVFLRTQSRGTAALEDARGAPGVAEAYSLSAEVYSPFLIRGIDTEVALRRIAALRDDPDLAREFAEGRSLVLSEFLASSLEYAVGDPVRLSTYDGAHEVRVAAIDDRFGYFPDDRGFALMALPTFERIFCVGADSGNRFVFDVADASDAETVAAAIAGRLPPDDVQWLKTAGRIQDEYRTDMDRDFWIFTVVLLLTVVLSFVGLWNSLTVALLERRREIGLLRTLGFTSGQVAGMLAAEAAALGMVGGAIALIAGVPVANDLVEAIRVISRLEVRPVLDHLDLALVPAAAVALALLATVPPALRLRSQHVPSATRME